MLNIFKHVYHHFFRDWWFYNVLAKNVNQIMKNPNLTDEQKGNQIYYDVFWKTWHKCGEPSLKGDFCSILETSSFMRDKLNQLHWSYPAKKTHLVRQYYQNSYGGLGNQIDGVQLQIDLWHFGNDPHLDNCLTKAFQK